MDSTRKGQKQHTPSRPGKRSASVSLTKISAGSAQRKQIGQEVLSSLSRTAGATGAVVYFLLEDEGAYEAVLASGKLASSLQEERLLKNHPAPRLFSAYGRKAIQPGEAEPAVASWMAASGIEICLPLRGRTRLIGLCGLSEKKTAGRYLSSEIRALEEAASQIGPLIENLLLGEALQKARLLLRRANRSEAIRAMSGEFAHEIRNPLTSIKTFISLVSELKADPEFINRFSRVALEDVERIERLLDDMLQFTKSSQIRLGPEDINELVSSSVYFIRMEAERRAIHLRVECAENLPDVLLDRQQIKQVLLNLFLNAIDAMAEGGELYIRTGRFSRDSAEWIEIEITDSGCGISPENLRLIFDPFFTTKRERPGSREGTGLGLSVVQQIVEDHRGHIEVKSRLGSGTTFTIHLPLTSLECDTPVTENIVSQ